MRGNDENDERRHGDIGYRWDPSRTAIETGGVGYSSKPETTGEKFSRRFFYFILTGLIVAVLINAIIEDNLGLF
tara:strand:- start:2319 stop:2540 length:222 start_codon:yes stop_codon:yes gene_type:complete